ncbi:carbonate dehydratase, eukaryotic-type [Cooperia oncophora]
MLYSGGNLVGRYYLQQFHFHWDGNDRFGSEHTLDGLHYPLEVHFVHIREHLNESTAPLVPDGIAVNPRAITRLILQEACFLTTQPRFSDTLEAAQLRQGTGGSSDITPFSFPSFVRPESEHCTPGPQEDPSCRPVKEKTGSFGGSLTTPPCSENVLWTILVQPNYVSDVQLRTLRRHLREDGSLLIDNWRTTQPMNGRTLYLNKKKPKNEPRKPMDVAFDIAYEVSPIIIFCLLIVVIM